MNHGADRNAINHNGQPALDVDERSVSGRAMFSSAERENAFKKQMDNQGAPSAPRGTATSVMPAVKEEK